MSGYRILSLDESEALTLAHQKETDEYRSIFTYSGLGPSPNPAPFVKEKKSKNKAANMMSSAKSYFTYSKLPQDGFDIEADSGHHSAFDYKSIFSYNGSNKNSKLVQIENSQNPARPPADVITTEGITGKLIANLALVLSYLLVFFTLPISVWFCFKNLPQWERIVVYRLGKLQGVKGPGNIFLIPWLDCCSKLDLRTQLICHPVKQFLTKDQAIVEAGCSIFYRICDPVMYTSNVRDPELRGLKILANAITLKRLETSEEREFHPSKKIDIEGRIQTELNVITTPWGIEISSVQIENFRVLKEAQPVNAFMDMMQQMGISFGSGAGTAGGDAGAASSSQHTTVSLADVGINWQGADCGLKSNNAGRLQDILNAATGTVDNGTVICFKIGTDQPFFADFSQGKGQVYENTFPGEVNITLSLPQTLFDSLMNGASQSQFLQAYLEGQITIEGDTQALMQLQKLLPNLHDT